jgi:hypothetical protein
MKIYEMLKNYTIGTLLIQSLHLKVVELIFHMGDMIYNLTFLQLLLGAGLAQAV